MADVPTEATGGLTPLEMARTPFMDLMAARGSTGLVQTVPDGHYPGSENAILSIMGYQAEDLPEGRGYLEALGCGIGIPDDNISVARYRLSGDCLSPLQLAEIYPDYRFHPLTDSTGLVYSTIDRDLIAELPHISIWSKSKRKFFRKFPPFPSASRRKTALIGAVPLLKGIALSTEIDWIRPHGATGDTLTDYKAKAEAAIEALERHDIVIVHVEACDTASHARDYEKKVDAIENIDSGIVKPLMELAQRSDGHLSLALLPDHPCLWQSGQHTASPVPVAIYNPLLPPDHSGRFSEKEALYGSIKDLRSIYRLYE